MQDIKELLPIKRILYSKKKASRKLPKYDKSEHKILGKRSKDKVATTPNGSNAVLKALRKQ